MDSALKAILLRFPECSEKIINQIETNEDFESLCSDYALCLDMLKALEVDSGIKHARLEEYIEIKISLEQDLLKYL